MSLAHRVIPVLLKRGYALVKGKQFDSWRIVGHPLQAARIHAARGVDELMILDIGCDKPDLKMVESLTEAMFTPVTVGGGIRHLEDVRDLLNAGADKICTTQISIIKAASEKFGRQAVCASVTSPQCAVIAQANGAGEILLQCVERDGMMTGYDLASIEKIRGMNIPVIASCGCGSYDDMVAAIHAGADAVAAGAFFQFTDATPKEAARYLKEKGIETRA